MAHKHLWFVRAGKDAAFIEEFRSGGIVAIGWAEVGPLSADVTDTELARLFKEHYPTERDATRHVWAAMVKRFLREVHVGDGVVTYDPEQRIYLLGAIQSEVEWRPGSLPRVRRVSWTQQVSRDVLSASTRNNLGAIATFFRTSAEATEELFRNATPIGTAVPPPPLPPPDPDVRILRDEVAGKADQFVEDHIARLDWKGMQQLVAGILRAMGYRTQVAPEGSPDRGVDIFASPDGLGLQEPRIFVEVKHRPGNAMSADEVRAFLGGRRPGDKCLYVSTGGFTREARYEADRATVPLTLITMTQLRELLVQYYENLDAATRALVPLQRLYWPVE